MHRFDAPSFHPCLLLVPFPTTSSVGCVVVLAMAAMVLGGCSALDTDSADPAATTDRPVPRAHNTNEGRVSESTKEKRGSPGGVSRRQQGPPVRTYSPSAVEANPDVRLDTSVTYVTDGAYGIQPGDTVCLEGGRRPRLQFREFHGTAADPIVITNCPGEVVKIGGYVAYGLLLKDTRHVRVVGQRVGSDAGIQIDGRGTTKVGLALDWAPSFVEVAHLEIYDTSFAGVKVDTDDVDRFGPEAIIEGIHLHHLFVHRTGGEGAYIGSTSAPSDNIPMYRSRFANNVFAETDWDGFQIQNTRGGVVVEHNVIAWSGRDAPEAHSKGLQIGDNSAVTVRNNVIHESASQGLAIFASGGVRVYGNVLSRTGGVFIDNRRVTWPDSVVSVSGNLLRDTKRIPAFKIYNEVQPVRIQHNRLNTTGTLYGTASGAGPLVTVSANTVADRALPFGFAAPSAGNFCLEDRAVYPWAGLQDCISCCSRRRNSSG